MADAQIGTEMESIAIVNGAAARYRLLSPPVVLETVDEETIVVNLDSGLYYDLNHSGSHALRLLASGAGLGEISGWLIARYGIDAGDAPDVQAGVSRLAIELVGEGILAEDEDESRRQSPEADPEPSRRPWAEPALGRHDDMQELLLLDPVHDVDAGGWPSQA